MASMSFGEQAAAVAAIAAVSAAIFAFLGFLLEWRNAADNRAYRVRLRAEEHYFKLHLLWQELRIASMVLESVEPPTADSAPEIDGLPITQLTEALSTKDLLGADAAAKVRVARDDLVQIGQFVGDARAPEVRRHAGFERRFTDQMVKTLASVNDARQAIIGQLPT